MSDEIREALEKIFSADSELYQQRGFQRRVGFGERPAQIHIDLANAWTRPGNAFTCDGWTTIIPGVQRLLAAGAQGVPDDLHDDGLRGDRPERPERTWACGTARSRSRCSSSARRGRDRRAHRARARRAGDRQEARERVPRHALANMLRAAQVDTVIVTGVTMAGCVRHTVEDAIGYGFRPIVVRECVGDRVAGVVEWNLFDIDAKFGDVEPLETVLDYLDGIEPFSAVDQAVSVSRERSSSG